MEQSPQGSQTKGEGGSSSLTVKNVVTVFLSYRGRILLLRRSDQVGSYRGKWAGTADICIVGADSVMSDGSVVNKVGTFPLAMSAREHDKPFYVLCDKSKFNLRSIFEGQNEIEERDEVEVLPYAHGPLLTVRNPYFDTTPSALVSNLITEDGALSSNELQALFRGMLSETYL